MDKMGIKYHLKTYQICFLLLYNEKQNNCDKISKTRK